MAQKYLNADEMSARRKALAPILGEIEQAAEDIPERTTLTFIEFNRRLAPFGLRVTHMSPHRVKIETF